MLDMVTWIPSIYPLYVSIHTSTMDPSWEMGSHDFDVMLMGRLGRISVASEA
jgi:hypothetical protein